MPRQAQQSCIHKQAFPSNSQFTQPSLARPRNAFQHNEAHPRLRPPPRLIRPMWHGCFSLKSTCSTPGATNTPPILTWANILTPQASTGPADCASKQIKTCARPAVLLKPRSLHDVGAEPAEINVTARQRDADRHPNPYTSLHIMCCWAEMATCKCHDVHCTHIEPTGDHITATTSRLSSCVTTHGAPASCRWYPEIISGHCLPESCRKSKG
jgi:hypothetical protein